MLIAALVVPTWSAFRQQSEAARIVATARAGQNVFIALRYLRPERGTVHAALDAQTVAEPTLLTTIAGLRGQAAPALDAVLRDCVKLRCVATDPRLDGARRDPYRRRFATGRDRLTS